MFAAQAGADRWRRRDSAVPRWAKAAIVLVLANLAYEAVVLELGHRLGWL